MCLDVSCVHSQGGSSSSGVGKAGGVTIGVAVLAGLTYNVLVVTWPLFLALEIVGLCIAYWNSPVVRGVRFVAGAVLAGSLWVARWAYRRCRKPSTEIAVPVPDRVAAPDRTTVEQRFQATVYLPAPPGKPNKVLFRDVTEPIAFTAEEVARRTRAAYIAANPTAGQVRVHVQPVAS